MSETGFSAIMKSKTKNSTIWSERSISNDFSHLSNNFIKRVFAFKLENNNSSDDTLSDVFL